MVADLIKRRDIDAGNLGGTTEKFLFGIAAVRLHPTVEGDHFHHDLFPFADLEQVDEVSQRLGVAGAGAARDNDRIIFRTFGSKRIQAGQVKHIEYIGIGQLILERKADHIKLAQRVKAFQAIERQSLLTHQCFKVGPRGIYPLSPAMRVGIDDVVQDFQPQMGHTNFIGIREAESDTKIDRILILDDAVQFAADIPCGLLHL